MFLATHLPAPLPPSTQTSLSVESPTPPTSSSPAVVSALDRLDTIIRSALGRSIHGDPHVGDGGNASATATTGGGSSSWWWSRWSSDDAVAAATMAVVFLLVFLALLVIKLLLGMILLRYSRDRYARMKVREHAVATGVAERESHDARGSKRVGGRGQVETGDERRRWIYADDPEGLRSAREREKKATGMGRGGGKDLGGVIRYEMVNKRIW